MNKKQYNNVIENTLKHEQSAQTDDSLATARAIFDNMGVALPQGDIKTVYETIKTDNYMGWKSCTMQEAQAAADRGVAAIGISEDRIVVLLAIDEEQPVKANTLLNNKQINSTPAIVFFIAFSPLIHKLMQALFLYHIFQSTISLLPDFITSHNCTSQHM